MDENENQRPTSRRSNKPLMEKRRRQRINNCLTELKSLVLQAMKKDSTQYSKLEKADILEMTVKHLKMVQRQHMAAAMATDPNVVSRYRAGFNECATEVVRYLDNTPGGNPELKQRVLNHLAGTMTQIPVVPLYQTAQMTYPGLPVHVQIPQTTCLRQMPSAFSQGQFHMNGSSDYFHPSQHSYSSVDSVQSCSSINSANSGVSSIARSPSPVVRDSSPRIPSPTRHAPSPCDSDSGLSDISAVSSSKEDIAHYNGQFSLKHNDDSLLNDNKTMIEHHQSLRESVPILQGPYLALSPKMGKISRAHAHESPKHLLRNMAEGQGQQMESMWRPW